MLHATIFLLAGLGVFFTALAFVKHDEEAPVTKAICGMLSIFIWLGLSLGAITVEVPYSHLYENAADNSYQVVNGVQQIQAAEPALPWLFMMIAVLMIVYMWYVLTGYGVKKE